MDFSQDRPCSKINLTQAISVKNNAKLCAKVILIVIIDYIVLILLLSTINFFCKYYS